MSLASLPRLSRPAADEERLRRLRAQAVARMEEEERAAGVVRPVSRRGVLRGLGMVVAGMVPGVAALEKAYGATGSVRSGAPQYGAPSWPAWDNPPVDLPVGAKVMNSRQELGSPGQWTTRDAQVLLTKGKGGDRGLAHMPAMIGYYNADWGGGIHPLMAVPDPESDAAYILRANQTFYAVVGSDMVAVLLEAGVLVVHGSLFKSASGGLAGAIKGFARESDSETYQDDRVVTKIDLEKGLPQEFWVRNTADGWRQNSLSVVKVRRNGKVAEVEVRSDNSQPTATFTVDLEAKALVKTTFEGKEWAA